jgi:hypothetical protein
MLNPLSSIPQHHKIRKRKRKKNLLGLYLDFMKFAFEVDSILLLFPICFGGQNNAAVKRCPSLITGTKMLCSLTGVKAAGGITAANLLTKHEELSWIIQAGQRSQRILLVEKGGRELRRLMLALKVEKHPNTKDLSMLGKAEVQSLP